MLDLLQSSNSVTKNLHNLKMTRYLSLFWRRGRWAGRRGCHFPNFIPNYSDYQIVQNYLLGCKLIIVMLICFLCVCVHVYDHVYLIDLSPFFSYIQPLVEPSCQKQIAITHLLDHCQLIRAFTTNVYGLLVCKKEILNLCFKTNFM